MSCIFQDPSLINYHHHQQQQQYHMNSSLINETETEYDNMEFEIDSIDMELVIRSVVFVGIYLITFFVGFIGNILVMFAIGSIKKLQSVTNIFLFSLATADLLLIAICVPIRVIEFFTNYWFLGPIMCKVFHYMHNFTAICSVLNLTVMSLERYLAILYPLKAKYTCTRKRARVIICIIWIISIIAASPILLGKKLVKQGKLTKVDVCIRVWCPTAWKIFEIYRTLLILVIPFYIIMLTYCKICIKLWYMPYSRSKLTEPLNSSKSNKKKLKSFEKEKAETEILQLDSLDSSSAYSTKQLQSQPTVKPSRNMSSYKADDDATRKQIIIMLILIIGLFFICWTPITINYLLIAFGVVSNVNYGGLWYMRITFFVMSYLNSCINPIVYAFMSKNFREGFKLALSTIFKRNKKNDINNKDFKFNDKKVATDSNRNNSENRLSDSQELKLCGFNSTLKTTLTGYNTNQDVK